MAQGFPLFPARCGRRGQAGTWMPAAGPEMDAAANRVRRRGALWCGMTRRDAAKSSKPPAAWDHPVVLLKAGRVPAGEVRARNAWGRSRVVSPILPADGRPLPFGQLLRPATLAELVLAFVPGRGRKRGERGRPRAHAERIAMALRCELGARRGRASVRAAALAELRAAGVPGGWRCENAYLQMRKDIRWLRASSRLGHMLEPAQRLERGERPVLWAADVTDIELPRRINGSRPSAERARI